VNWLRRRDPGYRVLRRGARLSLVAAAGLFGGTYGLDNPMLGLYTLFSVIATGFISQLPGDPVQRARVLLLALPVGWILVSTGSFLAANTWIAAAGMLVVGFVVPFAGVGGPSMIGLATGLQLFYIAASFPPYAPTSLPSRLAGVTLGIGLLIAAELLLWPDPAPPRYRQRLAGAAGAVARYLDLVADLPAGRAVDPAELARRKSEAMRALDGVWLAKLPLVQRPASAGARDRALRHGDMLLRRLCEHAERIVTGYPDLLDDELADLLRESAEVVHAADRTLHRSADPIRMTRLSQLEFRIRDVHDRPPPGPVEPGGRARDAADISRLRFDVLTLHVAQSAHDFGVAARIATGLGPPRRSPGSPGLDEFWYAHRSAPALYWWQFRLHLTTRSVYFQGAVRVSVALAVARVIAGFAHLNHGFWVLLAILTLLRTSAVDTRSALRPVLLGTLLGAAVGSLLLTAADTPKVTLVALPLAMVLTFAVSPLLPQIWGQALFTVLFVMVFAQAGPASLQLAGARLLDVTIGATLGVSAGLLLWPRGGGGELRQSIARYLEVSAAAAAEVTRTLAGRPCRQHALGAAQRASVLAEASFMQYQMERDDPRLPRVNWQAALTAAQRLHLGAVSRLRQGAHARLTEVADGAAPLGDFAGRLRRGYDDLARQLYHGRLDRRVSPPPPPEGYGHRVRSALDAGESRTAALNLVDVETWLTSAGADLERIQQDNGKPAPEEPVVGRRTG